MSGYLKQLPSKLEKNISYTKSQYLNVSHLVLHLSTAQSIEARWLSGEWRVVGAAPIGDASTTSEWSTILLPSKV